MTAFDADQSKDFLQRLFASCLRQGIDACSFRPEAPLVVRLGGQERENPKVPIDQDTFRALVRELTSQVEGPPPTSWTEIQDKTFSYSLVIEGRERNFTVQPSLTAGRPTLVVFLAGQGTTPAKEMASPRPDALVVPTEPPSEASMDPTGPDAKSPSQPTPPPSGISFQGELDPIFTGAAGCTNPAEFDDPALATWWNDFCETLSAVKNPKPKDLVLNPNKPHPYVTVVGGMLPVRSVKLEQERKITERLARLMLAASKNPEAQLAFERQGVPSFESDIAYRTGSGRRYRVNLADCFDGLSEHGLHVTMRVLAEEPLTVDQLGLPKVVVDTVASLRMGLVLINGVTGSGKSTTMAALLDYLLKTKSINLLTIENPIEVVFPAQRYPNSVVLQREVGMHTVNAQTAMRSAVRQTLNVAMVGEIRNASDMSLAFDLAISGHLILATLHANTIAESVTRIVEMYPPSDEKKVREVLATQYKLGLAQILVTGKPKPVELVLEIMRMNAEVQALILGHQDQDRQLSMRELLEAYSEVQGSKSLDQALVELYNQERIDEDTLMFNSPDPDGLVLRQNKLGLSLSKRWDPTGALVEAALDRTFKLVSSEGEQK